MTDRSARPFAAARLTIALALAVCASPAVAIVEIVDDVSPAPPEGFPNPILSPQNDANDDGIYDWLEPGGNNVFTSGLVEADPDFPNGSGPFGVAWNDPRIWVDYDTPQNILVGQTGSGRLTINAGTDLRYQHLVLGGLSDGADIGGAAVPALTFETQIVPEEFDIVQDIASLAPLGRSRGFGTVVVTGPGSTFNNDPSMVPQAFAVALNLANGATGNDINAPVFDIVGATGLQANESRSVDQNENGFDVIVGFNGGGRLEVSAGGQVQIQDALMAAVLPGTSGDVLVDGSGSYLVANGRIERQSNQTMTSNDTTSFIGGLGRGELTVSNGGRADFFAGLTIGHATGGVGIALDALPGTVDGSASGTVTVNGPGSNVTATTGLNGLAIAVGEPRATPLTAAYDPTTDTGVASGQLNLVDNGSVLADGSAAIGPQGRVELSGGLLNVSNALLHDGAIQGFGTVQAGTLATSPNARINGVDNPLDNPMPANGPLRLVVGAGADPQTNVLTNRGVIGGVLDATIAGGVDNQGVIEAAGSITATRMFTRTTSRLVGGTNGEGTLRLLLTDPTSVVDATPVTPAGVPSNFGAFQNRGEIAGSIDFTIAGGFVNGDVGVFAGEDPEGSAGGTIRASGRIVSGTFINHRYGVISVGAGESLTMLATDAVGVTLPNLVVQDGTAQDAGRDGDVETTPADFVQANLGAINVSGGSLEVGRAIATLPTTVADIDHNRLFRNARAVNVNPGSTSTNNDGDEMVGTITGIDATLSFREGLYNTGVVAFTGGSSAVSGEVINAGFFRAADGGADGDPLTLADNRPNRNGIDYDADADEEYLRPGVLLATGAGTTVSFADNVTNTGLIAVGPGATMNFLGDLDNTGGTVQIAADTFTSTGAVIQVGGDIRISGGGLFVDDFGDQLPNPDVGASFALATASSSPMNFATSGASSLVDGVSLTVLDASGVLTEDSLFTVLDLPD
ncbi:MAG: hypothetical protein AAF805_04855, partial [Planctomycetota bacterium]